MELRADKIVVFGGGSGIGKAIAKRLVSAGATVTIVGRTESKLINAAKEIGKNVYYIPFDIANCNGHNNVFLQAEKLMGGLNGFVNSAAIGLESYLNRGYEPFDITPEEWDAVNNVNYKAAFFLMRNEILYLREHTEKSNILNIASNAACMDITGSYGAAKLDMIKWTKALGKRNGKYGIIINGIAPGATVTDMIASYAEDENAPYERHAIGRFIKPGEIAELAYYLMSNYGEIICGHTVVADGGDSSATL